MSYSYSTGLSVDSNSNGRSTGHFLGSHSIIYLKWEWELKWESKSFKN